MYKGLEIRYEGQEFRYEHLVYEYDKNYSCQAVRGSFAEHTIYKVQHVNSPPGSLRYPCRL
jgi:hypothetical protein